MVLRLMEASSSLWPPDRKVMPLGAEEDRGLYYSLKCANL